MKQIAADIEEDLGAIDMLIANAGSCFYFQPERFKSEQCLSLMNLNYGGMLHCIEAVLPKMLERNTGSIVGIASLAGYRGLPKAGAYSASKAAMISFLESFRFQCERKGISVTIVNPGFVKTPLTDKNDFPMPALIEASLAAKYICNGIERRQKEITFPFAFSLAMKLLRVIPFRFYEYAVKECWKRLGYI